MASVITGIIDPQAFEVVRDRIGRILAEELAQQYSLSASPDLNAQNWIERFLPYQENELPCVNVMLAEGTYDGQTAVQNDGTYRYYIDVHVNATSTHNNPGNQKAIRKLHKLLGVCRAILMDARYKTLGFSTRPGYVMNRHVESIQIKEPGQKEHDMMSTAMGRIVILVKVPEITAYKTGVAGKQIQTTVKLADTDKGYLWVDGTDEGVFDESFDATFE